MAAKKDSFRSGNRKPNFIYSIISVALVLFLLGFFGLVLLEARQLIIFVKERMNLMVEMDDSLEEESLADLQAYLEGQPYLIEGSLDYIPKEEAIELLREELGDDFLALDMPNPLYDVLLFNVRAVYLEKDSLEAIRADLKQFSFVSDVYFQDSVVDVIAQNIRKIGWIALGIGIFFIFVAFALIHNTIRLALYSNRFLIKNQELVGASWEFISRPFLLRSVQHGFLSGLIACGLLYGLLLLAQLDMPELKDLQHLPSLLSLFGMLIIFGILITLGSTYYVVNKYLKMRVDDLY